MYNGDSMPISYVLLRTLSPNYLIRNTRMLTCVGPVRYHDMGNHDRQSINGLCK